MTELTHVGSAISSALLATDTSQLDWITDFGPGDVLVFDGDWSASASGPSDSPSA